MCPARAVQSPCNVLAPPPHLHMRLHVGEVVCLIQGVAQPAVLTQPCRDRSLRLPDYVPRPSSLPMTGHPESFKMFIAVDMNPFSECGDHQFANKGLVRCAPFPLMQRRTFPKFPSHPTRSQAECASQHSESMPEAFRTVLLLTVRR